MQQTTSNPNNTASEAIREVDATIQAWCLKEMTRWRQRGVDPEHAWEIALELSSTRRCSYLFKVQDGVVTIVTKPDSVNDGPVMRARQYKDFLQRTVSRFIPNLNLWLVIDLDDGGLELDDLPIFVFQKPTGSKAVLLPDIDFLSFNFYAPIPDYKDRLTYDEKSISAIFVGSSSGGVVTRRAVDADLHPRLRSARFFQEFSDVTFHVPQVTQYDSEETRAHLRTMGIGNGDRIEWPEQFNHRFIISVDGNGATCSRVAVALLSNGVLLKYASPHQLYYFQSLIPWLHYVPIEHDADVLAVLELERKSPGYFQIIAEAGKTFAETYLTRHQAMKYTAWLLQMYAESMGSGSAGLPLPSEEFGRGLEVLAHVQNKGDMWFSADDWVGSPGTKKGIEGFLIEPNGTIRRSELHYQVILQDGSISDWAAAGEFCGSRGKNQSLRGVRLELRGEVAGMFNLVTHGRFVDGTASEPIAMGELCQSATRAPLEAFLIEIKPVG